LALPRIQPGKLLQRIVEHDQTYVPERTWSYGFIQDQLDSRIAFGRVLVARVVNQYLAHHSRRNGKKMSPVLKAHFFMLGKTQVGFVHQGGALQGVIRTLFLQIAVRQSAQVGINQGD